MKYLGPPQSGSQANTVASRNRFGQYYRTRAIPVQPRTTRQVSNRGTFGSLATNWSTILTDSQRQQWRDYAGITPVVNSLGVSIYLTGFQTYVGVNQLLARAGLSNVAVPPVSPGFATNIVTGITAVATGSVVTVSFATFAAPNAYQVFAGQPRLPGQNFEGNYRFISKSPTPASAGTQVISTAYTNVWGAITSGAGKKIFFRVLDFETGGAKGTPYQFTVTIT